VEICIPPGFLFLLSFFHLPILHQVWMAYVVRQLRKTPGSTVGHRYLGDPEDFPAKSSPRHLAHPGGQILHEGVGHYPDDC
jgi:hypothetical protein